MIKNYIFLMLLGIVMCEIPKTEYNINLYGVPVAKCIVTTLDTVINNRNFVKLKYQVNSVKIMNLFYSVKNTYITIVDKDNYKIKFFSKKTSQPNIINKISTIESNSQIFYDGKKYKILKDEYNIFSLLQKISENNFNDINNPFTIDREGKKYKGKLKKSKGYYELFLEEKDINDYGLIKNTDIFSWALFIPGTSKKIYYDKENKTIQSYEFKKGFLKFTAKIIN